MKTRLFLFDLDGTLVSTGGAGTRALAKAFATLHNIENAHRLLDPSGKTDPAIFREIMRIARSADLSETDIVRVSETYLQHLEDELKNASVRILKGALEFVEKAAKTSSLLSGLGTGNLERGARLKLAPADLNRYFSFGGFGSDAEDRAEMLRCGHRRAEQISGSKIAPDDVLIIGDTPLDVAAARRAGYKVAAVATGRYTFDQLQKNAPDFVYNDLSEAHELLETQHSMERT